VVLEPGRTRIYGVHTGRFTRVLTGQGGVFGVKFRPGGFRSFLGRPVSTLRNRSAAFCDVFGPDAAGLESEIFVHREDSAMIALAERFFIARLPPPDPDVDRVGEIVDGIAADRGITTVEQVTERWQLGKRTLQRLFNEYVGVGPKWVISRYRLHEAIERLSGDGPEDWTQLALELGYFDQAHFIRDFKALVGRPPAAYVRGS
jgi:AraC-like DNA-binding protein